MDKRFDKIERKLDEILKSLADHRVEAESRITKIEMSQKGFVTVISLVCTGIIAYLANIFSK